MANRAAGKGYENENFYENIKFQFCGIENIHVMRSSLSKLLEACELKTPSMAAFINGIQSSGWLRHIHAILDTSLLVARSLQEGVNVLVHCSDGIRFSVSNSGSIDWIPRSFFIDCRVGSNRSSLLTSSGAGRSLLPHVARFPVFDREGLAFIRP